MHGEFFDGHLLEGYLLANCDQDSEALATGLIQTVDKWRGEGKVQDDASVLIVG